MTVTVRAVQRRSRVPYLTFFCGLAVLAAQAKKRYPNSALAWLVKRLVGYLLSRILPIPFPDPKRGRGSCAEIGKILKSKGCKKPLIVTDEMLVKHGLVKKCTDAVEQAGFQHTIFDKVVPNPPSDLVEEGFRIYKNEGCDSIVAFGGGSPMDTAKVIGAKVSNPKPVKDYQGFLKATLAGFRPMPPFIAVPTTAGTGSETTVAAIITIKEEKKKITIADLGLVPHFAVLDPEILEKLPKSVTAATGMDAMTHAVESFLGAWSSDYTRKMSLEAVGATCKYLIPSYENGADLNAREEMLHASYKAGLAFTRANVGYVHAIAHQLGGMFHTAHGDANAMLLPHILDFYLEGEEAGGFCTDMYCELGVAARLAETSPHDVSAKRKLAKDFVARIREMNTTLNIPKTVDLSKAEPDFRSLDSSILAEKVACRALKEAHGELHSPTGSPIDWIFDLGYPIPKYMTQNECEAIVAKILPGTPA